ncbi:permease-like cell division protein FtsX [Gordonia alkaliphila]|uniref:permease-like cell division protein FtsX n=1 Tax=Gordonia alkaliphila TaxID=1053547 RepID=UPI001FF3A296|nr:permease-like cell division protein FtsX [Gordonia alkaliphila]MCK0438241.1 permease-like cell division protein FtsX [Gordonia alkaliphila]
MRANFILREVLTGFRRNLTMTLAMILTTAVTLGMLGGGLLVIQMADKSQKIFLDRVEMQFFITDAVTEADANCTKDPCAQVKRDLEAEPGVSSVTYISKEQAFETAKASWQESSPEVAEFLTPDSTQAALRVRTSDPARFGEVLDKFAKAPGIDGVLDQRELVKRIFSVLDGARNAAFVIAAILALAAIMLIVNTVQIAAYTRRTEVSIMRLVGATRWYTQLPFLLEAVLAAVIGALLAIGGLFLGKTFFFDKALEDLYGVNILARITAADVWFVSPWLLLAGIVVAGVTAYGTLRVYVRD